jgi:hypothetical protein
MEFDWEFDWEVLMENSHFGHCVPLSCPRQDADS